MRSWLIVNSPDCDVVVDSPLASARHCQLTQTAEGFLLNDLGSTNGTFVNGVRITGATRLAAGDSITLGRTVPFPWPPELTTSVSIGRLGDNDIVLDDARVSGHHARLVIVPGQQTMIEDLGSSNGTFLNSADRRISGPTPITDSDTLLFGTFAVPAAGLLRVPVKPEPTPRPEAPAAAAAIAESGSEPGAAMLAFALGHRYRWHLAWLVQAPAFAIFIVLVFRGQPDVANADAHTRGIAATTFALALAAIWLGSTLAIAETAVSHALVRDGRRLAILAGLCALACVLLLSIVDGGSALKGPRLAMWGVLTVSSLVGLFLGLAVASSVRNRAAAVSVLQLCFLAMIVFGGWVWPLPKMIMPVKLLADAMPTRWAFEGLLLLETEKQAATAIPDDADPVPGRDFVDEYFPADSDRMGPMADAMALSSMMIGLGALSALISGPSRNVQSAP